MTLNANAVIFTAMAVPLAVMALQLDGGLLPLMISSSVALVAMVIWLAFHMTVLERGRKKLRLVPTISPPSR